jgi:hypothetical protein
MWAEDQRVRTELRTKVAQLNNNWGDPQLAPLYRQVDHQDSIHLSQLKTILAQGWPTLREVGKDGAFAAWAIAQHANQIPFQEACLNAMKPLLATQEVNPVHFAELTDRVLVNQKRKQWYGMAIDPQKGGFYPIEDEANVNQRRQAIGLEPLAVYAHLNGFEYPQTAPSTK